MTPSSRRGHGPGRVFEVGDSVLALPHLVGEQPLLVRNLRLLPNTFRRVGLSDTKARSHRGEAVDHS